MDLGRLKTLEKTTQFSRRDYSTNKATKTSSTFIVTPEQLKKAERIKKLNEIVLDLSKLDKMVRLRQLDEKIELARLIDSMQSHGDTNYEENLTKKLELLEKEYEQLFTLEEKKLQLIFKLSNNYRVKAVFNEMGRMEDERVDSEVRRIKSEMGIVDKAIKLRREYLKEKAHELKYNPIIKGFNQLNRVIDPKTGHFVYLSDGPKKKVFKSREQRYTEKEAYLMTKPPTRFKEFTSDFEKPKTLEELEDEVFESLNKQSIMAHITKDTPYERLTKNGYKYRVDDSPVLYYGNVGRVEKLERKRPPGWDQSVERLEIRERVFVDPSEVRRRDEERRLDQETLFLSNASKVLDSSLARSYKNIGDAVQEGEGRRQPGGLSQRNRSCRKVSFGPVEVYDDYDKNFRDKRSMRVKKPNTVSSDSHFKPDNSIEDLNAALEQGIKNSGSKSQKAKSRKKSRSRSSSSKRSGSKSSKGSKKKGKKKRKGRGAKKKGKKVEKGYKSDKG